MKYRFGWLCNLALLVFGLAGAPRAAAQEIEKLPPPKSERPAPPPDAPKVDPVPAPMAEPIAFDAGPSRPTVVLGVDYLQWWLKRDTIPQLLNTSPRSDTQTAGTQLDPSARTLFRRDGLSYGTNPGGRVYGLVGLDDENRLTFEASLFMLERRSIDARFAGNDGAPLLTRPFFDQFNSVESGYDVSSPGIGGSIAFASSNRIHGFETNVGWQPFACGTCGTGCGTSTAASACGEKPSNFFKILLGVRQVSLYEQLDITETITDRRRIVRGGPNAPLIGFLGRGLAPGDGVILVDSFDGANRFVGPQIGATWRWHCGPATFDFAPKVAVGLNQQSYHVFGTTTLVTNGVPGQTVAGGLLALPSNSGHVSRNELIVVPELALKFRIELTRTIGLNLGYDVLYMSSVARPGAQIDRRIDPRAVPHDVAYDPTNAVAFPRAAFRDTDFWAHGLNFGVDLRW